MTFVALERGRPGGPLALVGGWDNIAKAKRVEKGGRTGMICLGKLTKVYIAR